MWDLNLFIQCTHQVAMAVLGGIYVTMGLSELDKIKENNSKKSVRFFLMIFSTLFFGLCLVFLNEWRGVGMFYSIFFSLFIVLGLISPKFAVGFFLYLLLARPWETFESQLMESMLRDYFYIVIISLAARKVRKREHYIRLNAGTLFVIALAVWAFITGFLSNHFSEAILKYVEVFSKGIILFLLLQNCFFKTGDTLAAKAALVISILETGVISARNTFLGTSNVSFDFESVKRLEGMGILTNSNDIAAILILALPFCVFFFLKRGIRKSFWPFAVGSFFLIGYLVYYSQSRGALLAFFAGLVGFMFTRLKSKKIMAVVCIVGFLGGIASFSLLNRKGADLSGSTSNRLIFWKAGVNMAVRNPMFGVGFWGFPENLRAYAVGGNFGTEREEMAAHSSWIQVLSENGFPGFFFYLSLWVYGLYRSWKIRREHPEYLSAIFAYGVASSFLSHAYQLYPYILLGLGITQSFLTKEERFQENKLFIEHLEQTA